MHVLSCGSEWGGAESGYGSNTECYECEKEISDKAPACPHCGAPAEGKKDGVYKTYYESGKLQRLETYKAGELDGPYKDYYENGQLEARSTFVAGKVDGPYERYYENGQLEKKFTIVAGEPDGLFEVYYENGQLKERGTYNMGEQCGEWIEEGDINTYPPCPPGLEDSP